jgi:basic amino acid/polyamine antiporter, APA family
LPTLFARVHSGRQTPWVAILFTALIALVLLLTVGTHPEALDILASTTVVLLLLAFVMVNVCVLVLRSDHVEHKHFRTPSVFPILGIVVSLALLDYQAVIDVSVFGFAALLLVLGLVLYGINVLAKKSLDRQAPQVSE